MSDQWTFENFSRNFLNQFSMPCAFNCCENEGKKRVGIVYISNFFIFIFHFIWYLQCLSVGESSSKLFSAHRMNCRWKYRNISSTISFNKQHPPSLVSRADFGAFVVQNRALWQTAPWGSKEFLQKKSLMLEKNGNRMNLTENWFIFDFILLPHFIPFRRMKKYSRMNIGWEEEQKRILITFLFEERHQQTR